MLHQVRNINHAINHNKLKHGNLLMNNLKKLENGMCTRQGKGLLQ